jgi:protease I
MAGKLDGKKVAFVVTDGFEQVELTGPKEGLEKLGATCEIISPKEGKVKGWKHVEWGDELDVDVPIAQASAEEYDAVVLPGGQMNPDKLRNVPEVQSFVRAFAEAGKPVAAICHGPWILIDSGLVDGVRMTSWPTVKTDLVNAGADWVDEEVVVDDGIITSRKPDDVPAFTDKIAEEILEPRHGAARRGSMAGRRVPPP